MAFSKLPTELFPIVIHHLISSCPSSLNGKSNPSWTALHNMALGSKFLAKITLPLIWKKFRIELCTKDYLRSDVASRDYFYSPDTIRDIRTGRIYKKIADLLASSRCPDYSRVNYCNEFEIRILDSSGYPSYFDIELFHEELSHILRILELLKNLRYFKLHLGAKSFGGPESDLTSAEWIGIVNFSIATLVERIGSKKLDVSVSLARCPLDVVRSLKLIDSCWGISQMILRSCPPSIAGELLEGCIQQKNRLMILQLRNIIEDIKPLSILDRIRHSLVSIVFNDDDDINNENYIDVEPEAMMVATTFLLNCEFLSSVELGFSYVKWPLLQILTKIRGLTTLTLCMQPDNQLFISNTHDIGTFSSLTFLIVKGRVDSRDQALFEIIFMKSPNLKKIQWPLESMRVSQSSLKLLTIHSISSLLPIKRSLILNQEILIHGQRAIQ